jgi:transcriptional regulator EpsA
MTPHPDNSSAPRLHQPPVALSNDQAQCLVRLMEAAPGVHRRYQFFVWTQSQLQPLVQHQLLVCGHYQRQRRGVVFDTFHSVVLSAPLLAAINDAEGPLMRAIGQAWADSRGRPTRLALPLLPPAARPAAELLGQELNTDSLLVHGVARPQRPAEIESLFIFGSAGSAGAAQETADTRSQACLDLVLPQLHRTWQRVVATESELVRPVAAQAERLAPARAPGAPVRQTVTPRECQILAWVREGKSNQQIAEALAISPLTVKNHVQKILRKLNASNRAQAVAIAMDQGLLHDAAARNGG